MNISIFGLGYVGTVCLSCFAQAGHQVIGVDILSQKVALLNCGQSPIVEQGCEELIKTGHKNGQISATTNSYQAVSQTEISLVCVGTPSQANGSLDLQYIERVCIEIGAAIKEKKRDHLIIIRSTVLPGTTHNILIPIIEKNSGKKIEQGFQVCYNPEFMREGSAIFDYHNPPQIVVGGGNEASKAILCSLYTTQKMTLNFTDYSSAEMIKYTSNCWHALKVGFANEIGRICKFYSIDAQQIMGIFCQDSKLNISPNYLKPGFAFGGSCLPKDLRALIRQGKVNNLNLPILNNIIPSNESHIQNCIDTIVEQGSKRIGVFGLSFKNGTDDLRESPIIEVIERLLGKGYSIFVYDKYVKLNKLVGTNRDYILNHIPHIAKLLQPTIDVVLKQAKTIVIANSEPEYGDLLNKISEEQYLIDLNGICKPIDHIPNYNGICW